MASKIIFVYVTECVFMEPSKEKKLTWINGVVSSFTGSYVTSVSPGSIFFRGLARTWRISLGLDMI